MGLETIAIIGVAAAVAGAGVAAYGQYQSGKTQNAIAQLNAAQQEKQAAAQSLALQTQAALQSQQAKANFQLRSAESQARLNNASAIEKQALNQDAINRQNLQKRRDEFARMQGEQRATIAASGVVESSGTPLDLLAETAAKIQQDQEEQHFANEQQRRTLFSEAAQERLGGKLALSGATLDRNSALAGAQMTEAASKGEALAGLRAGEISRLTGKASYQAGVLGAGASLLSGLSSAAGQYQSYRRTV